ncbi:MAG: SpoIIE family protein phosphatase [Chlamydiae bacterium]|nr:SpoIIE family protein phosphatase [Chlamydiota bacterium]MBI3265539.1 SpoIIE family protein phosphatase [Chlamydiota bacterium]
MFIKKLISIITLIAFGTLDEALLWASISSNPFKVVSPSQTVCFDIFIPKDLGSVVEKYQSPGSDHTVVLFQDIHANSEAQRSTSELLEYLSRKYGLRLVAMEAASGKIPTELFKDFPDKEVLREVTDFYVGLGQMTGAEFAALNGAKDLELFGIEDMDLYGKNFSVYLDTLLLRKEIKEQISKIKHWLSLLKDYIFSRDMNDFARQFEDYSQNKMDLERFAPVLEKWVEKLEVTPLAPLKIRGGKLSMRGENPSPRHSEPSPRHSEGVGATEESRFSHFPEFSTYLKILELKKKVDFKKLHEEMAKLLISMSGKVSGEELGKFLEKTLAFRLNEVSDRDFYEFVKKFSEEQGTGVEKYPAIQNYMAYLEEDMKVNDLQLFEEVENLSSQTLLSQCETPEQKSLCEYIFYADLLSRVADFGVKRSEYESYLSKKKENISKMIRFIQKKADTYFSEGTVGKIKGHLDQELLKLQVYYELALKRDRQMGVHALEKLKSAGPGVSALIVGGFHTEGIAKILKERGYSYWVVIPHVKDITGDHYEEVMLSQRTSASTFSSAQDERPLPRVIRKMTEESGFLKGSSHENLAPQPMLSRPGGPETLARRLNMVLARVRAAQPVVTRAVRPPEAILSSLLLASLAELIVYFVAGGQQGGGMAMILMGWPQWWSKWFGKTVSQTGAPEVLVREVPPAPWEEGSPTPGVESRGEPLKGISHVPWEEVRGAPSDLFETFMARQTRLSPEDLTSFRGSVFGMIESAIGQGDFRTATSILIEIQSLSQRVVQPLAKPSFAQVLNKVALRKAFAEGLALGVQEAIKARNPLVIREVYQTLSAFSSDVSSLESIQNQIMGTLRGLLRDAFEAIQTGDLARARQQMSLFNGIWDLSVTFERSVRDKRQRELSDGRARAEKILRLLRPEEVPVYQAFYKVLQVDRGTLGRDYPLARLEGLYQNLSSSYRSLSPELQGLLRHDFEMMQSSIQGIIVIRFNAANELLEREVYRINQGDNIEVAEIYKMLHHLSTVYERILAMGEVIRDVHYEGRIIGKTGKDYEEREMWAGDRARQKSKEVQEAARESRLRVRLEGELRPVIDPSLRPGYERELEEELGGSGLEPGSREYHVLQRRLRTRLEDQMTRAVLETVGEVLEGKASREREARVRALIEGQDQSLQRERAQNTLTGALQRALDVVSELYVRMYSSSQLLEIFTQASIPADVLRAYIDIFRQSILGRDIHEIIGEVAPTNESSRSELLTQVDGLRRGFLAKLYPQATLDVLCMTLSRLAQREEEMLEERARLARESLLSPSRLAAMPMPSLEELLPGSEMMGQALSPEEMAAAAALVPRLWEKTGDLGPEVSTSFQSQPGMPPEEVLRADLPETSETPGAPPAPVDLLLKGEGLSLPPEGETAREGFFVSHIHDVVDLGGVPDVIIQAVATDIPAQGAIVETLEAEEEAEEEGVDELTEVVPPRGAGLAEAETEKTVLIARAPSISMPNLAENLQGRVEAQEEGERIDLGELLKEEGLPEFNVADISKNLKFAEAQSALDSFRYDQAGAFFAEWLLLGESSEEVSEMAGRLLSPFQSLSGENGTTVWKSFCVQLVEGLNEENTSHKFPWVFRALSSLDSNFPERLQEAATESSAVFILEKILIRRLLDVGQDGLDAVCRGVLSDIHLLTDDDSKRFVLQGIKGNSRVMEKLDRAFSANSSLEINKLLDQVRLLDLEEGDVLIPDSTSRSGTGGSSNHFSLSSVSPAIILLVFALAGVMASLARHSFSSVEPQAAGMLLFAGPSLLLLGRRIGPWLASLSEALWRRMVRVDGGGESLVGMNQAASFSDGQNLGVFDGMNGAASRAASGAISHAMASLPRDASEEDIEAGLKDAYARASLQFGETMAATARLFTDRYGVQRVAVANVGDTRAYLIRGGRLLRLIEEAPDQPLRFKQEGMTGVPQISIHVLQPGDVLFLSSPGLHQGLSDEDILKIAQRRLKSSHLLAQELARSAFVQVLKSRYTQDPEMLRRVMDQYQWNFARAKDDQRLSSAVQEGNPVRVPDVTVEVVTFPAFGGWKRFFTEFVLGLRLYFLSRDSQTAPSLEVIQSAIRLLQVSNLPMVRGWAGNILYHILSTRMKNMPSNMRPLLGFSQSMFAISGSLRDSGVLSKMPEAPREALEDVLNRYDDEVMEKVKGLNHLGAIEDLLRLLDERRQYPYPLEKIISFLQYHLREAASLTFRDVGQQMNHELYLLGVWEELHSAIASNPLLQVSSTAAFFREAYAPQRGKLVATVEPLVKERLSELEGLRDQLKNRVSVENWDAAGGVLEQVQALQCAIQAMNLATLLPPLAGRWVEVSQVLAQLERVENELENLRGHLEDARVYVEGRNWPEAQKSLEAARRLATDIEALNLNHLIPRVYQDLSREIENHFNQVQEAEAKLTELEALLTQIEDLLKRGKTQEGNVMTVAEGLLEQAKQIERGLSNNGLGTSISERLISTSGRIRRADKTIRMAHETSLRSSVSAQSATGVVSKSDREEASEDLKPVLKDIFSFGFRNLKNLTEAQLGDLMDLCNIQVIGSGGQGSVCKIVIAPNMKDRIQKILGAEKDLEILFRHGESLPLFKTDDTGAEKGLEFVVKFLRRKSQEMTMSDEMDILGKLKKAGAKHAVKILGHSTDGRNKEGQPAYFIMESLEGMPLRRAMSLPYRLRIAQGLLEALEECHRNGIVHKDIKLENMMVSDVNGWPVVKLFDFGVAKNFGREGDENVPEYFLGNHVIGTLRFLSPEEALNGYGKSMGGALGILPTMDVYAMGAVFYELFTGVRFPMFEDEEALKKQVDVNPGSLFSEFPEGGETRLKSKICFDPYQNPKLSASLDLGTPLHQFIRKMLHNDLLNRSDFKRTLNDVEIWKNPADGRISDAGEALKMFKDLMKVYQLLGVSSEAVEEEMTHMPLLEWGDEAELEREASQLVVDIVRTLRNKQIGLAQFEEILSKTLAVGRTGILPTREEIALMNRIEEIIRNRGFGDDAQRKRNIYRGVFGYLKRMESRFVQLGPQTALAQPAPEAPVTAAPSPVSSTQAGGGVPSSTLGDQFLSLPQPVEGENGFQPGALTSLFDEASGAPDEGVPKEGESLDKVKKHIWILAIFFLGGSTVAAYLSSQGGASAYGIASAGAPLLMAALPFFIFFTAWGVNQVKNLLAVPESSYTFSLASVRHQKGLWNEDAARGGRGISMVCDGMSNPMGGEFASAIARCVIENQMGILSRGWTESELKKDLKSAYLFADGMIAQFVGQVNKIDFGPNFTLQSIQAQLRPSLNSIQNVSSSLADQLGSVLSPLIDAKLKRDGETRLNLGRIGTTAVTALRVPFSPKVLIASVGDSQAYVLKKNGTLLSLIKGDRVVGSYISKAVGILRSGEVPDIFSYELERGDVLFLTSDGVHDNLKDEEIRDIWLRYRDHPRQALRVMNGRACARGLLLSYDLPEMVIYRSVIRNSGDFAKIERELSQFKVSSQPRNYPYQEKVKPDDITSVFLGESISLWSLWRGIRERVFQVAVDSYFHPRIQAFLKSGYSFLLRGLGLDQALYIGYVRLRVQREPGIDSFSLLREINSFIRNSPRYFPKRTDDELLLLAQAPFQELIRSIPLVTAEENLEIQRSLSSIPEGMREELNDQLNTYIYGHLNIFIEAVARQVRQASGDLNKKEYYFSLLEGYLIQAASWSYQSQENGLALVTSLLKLDLSFDPNLHQKVFDLMVRRLSDLKASHQSGFVQNAYLSLISKYDALVTRDLLEDYVAFLEGVLTRARADFAPSPVRALDTMTQLEGYWGEAQNSVHLIAPSLGFEGRIPSSLQSLQEEIRGMTGRLMVQLREVPQYVSNPKKDDIDGLRRSRDLLYAPGHLTNSIRGTPLIDQLTLSDGEKIEIQGFLAAWTLTRDTDRHALSEKLYLAYANAFQRGGVTSTDLKNYELEDSDPRVSEGARTLIHSYFGGGEDRSDLREVLAVLESIENLSALLQRGNVSSQIFKGFLEESPDVPEADREKIDEILKRFTGPIRQSILFALKTLESEEDLGDLENLPELSLTDFSENGSLQRPVAGAASKEAGLPIMLAKGGGGREDDETYVPGQDPTQWDVTETNETERIMGPRVAAGNDRVGRPSTTVHLEEFGDEGETFVPPHVVREERDRSDDLTEWDDSEELIYEEVSPSLKGNNPTELKAVSLLTSSGAYDGQGPTPASPLLRQHEEPTLVDERPTAYKPSGVREEDETEVVDFLRVKDLKEAVLNHVGAPDLSPPSKKGQVIPFARRPSSKGGLPALLVAGGLAALLVPHLAQTAELPQAASASMAWVSATATPASSILSRQVEVFAAGSSQVTMGEGLSSLTDDFEHTFNSFVNGKTFLVFDLANLATVDSEGIHIQPEAAPLISLLNGGLQGGMRISLMNHDGLDLDELSKQLPGFSDLRTRDKVFVLDSQELSGRERDALVDFILARAGNVSRDQLLVMAHRSHERLYEGLVGLALMLLGPEQMDIVLDERMVEIVSRFASLKDHVEERKGQWILHVPYQERNLEILRDQLMRGAQKAATQA